MKPKVERKLLKKIDQFLGGKKTLYPKTEFIYMEIDKETHDIAKSKIMDGGFLPHTLN